MGLKEHYNKMYRESIADIASDHYEIDDMIDSKSDNRFGISLVIRPSLEVKKNVRDFLDELNKVEPHQYYYPESDIHLTLLSIISCYEGFSLDSIDPSEYMAIAQKRITTLDEKIKIHFKGLTASKSCIMLKGYEEQPIINDLRNQLRRDFKHSELQQSLDERYLLKTAHATILRFKTELSNKNAFLTLVDRYADYDFGTFEVDTIELVYTDWYHREKLVKKLHEFKL
ncbi:2'-5' RNA ligase [Winogradskyella epiphytica]|uniref:2'-5' RNA ligase n=2 Tax=Winogradskyella epiphytica TaxID=262005 RepID=A0A2V4XCF8_9FLAO|nr:2'-5' RNA ligase [Winogradskyella epiphytica]